MINSNYANLYTQLHYSPFHVRLQGVGCRNSKMHHQERARFSGGCFLAQWPSKTKASMTTQITKENTGQWLGSMLQLWSHSETLNCGSQHQLHVHLPPPMTTYRMLQCIHLPISVTLTWDQWTPRYHTHLFSPHDPGSWSVNRKTPDKIQHYITNCKLLWGVQWTRRGQKLKSTKPKAGMHKVPSKTQNLKLAVVDLESGKRAVWTSPNSGEHRNLITSLYKANRNSVIHSVTYSTCTMILHARHHHVHNFYEVYII